MIPDNDLPSPLWVFGYGSLLWNPGFEVAEERLARLDGYHRAFCMSSIHHRGTEENPGLVLALDAEKDASCQGVALRVMPGQEPEVLAALRERELISSAYFEAVVTLHAEAHAPFQALAYVIDREHVQYCGGLTLERQAEIIAHAHGGRGPNTEYLFNTADHLAELGIADPDLAWLAARLRNEA
ncbi:gamma-glutamylcyclotransferase [Vannielia litorea]|uniref:gamma-glutamylcyclotransferase n=1 Tax=Vannielia litorea TaxID=1217970 RepID=UPI001C94B7DF|nr:gamma-glutamylcyclotransferase [Vannielia litorea]MBY6049856.1 gamma-glutamylcyclotransferase [Vannielia litorea]MBY6077270.1 gamma-glutamylcyclotransferase [Vannielia litorea]